jgi:hypothetical protein
MGATVNVGIFVPIKISEPVDNASRFLGGGRIIKPDQRFAVDRFGQDRKILSDLMDGKVPPHRSAPPYRKILLN